MDVRQEETQDKLKAKVLKAIHSTEKKTTPPTPITHPLQAWNEEVHCFPELKSEEVVKATANSTHLAFLLRDGRACRICVASWEESPASKNATLESLRRRGGGGSGLSSRFQVLGDEEYAQQLQAELNSGRHGDGATGGDWFAPSIGGGAGGRQRWASSARPAGGVYLEANGTFPNILDTGSVRGIEWG